MVRILLYMRPYLPSVLILLYICDLQIAFVWVGGEERRCRRQKGDFYCYFYYFLKGYVCHVAFKRHFILLYVCPHTAGGLMQVRDSPSGEQQAVVALCVHVSSYCYACMCPHTAMHVLILLVSSFFLKKTGDSSSRRAGGACGTLLLVLCNGVFGVSRCGGRRDFGRFFRGFCGPQQRLDGSLSGELY